MKRAGGKPPALSNYRAFGSIMVEKNYSRLPMKLSRKVNMLMKSR